MSESFVKERKRFNDQWKRVTAILKKHRKRYNNKTDVLEEALDLLENHLSSLDEKK